VKKLFGRTDIEDALKKLEKLSQDEALMAIAQVLRVTRNVDDNLEEVIDGAQSMFSLVILWLILMRLVGRETNVAMHQIENYLGDLSRS
jgi:hypothetical protein